MTAKPGERQGKAAPAGAGVGVSPSQLAFQGNVADIIETMRRGALAADVLAQVAERVGVSRERLFEELRIPETALKAKTARTVALSSSDQERLYRAEKVMTRAQSVFEDADSAKAWVIGSNRALGGVSPLSLLDTEAGYELVLDTLGRIAYGVIS